MNVTGSLLDGSGAAIPGAEVLLEVSTDGGATWSLVKSGKPNGCGAFSLPTGRIVGDRTFRVRFAPSAGVEYISALMPVTVPVTTATVIPAGATSGWLSVPSVQVTMSATPGSLTVLHAHRGDGSHADPLHRHDQHHRRRQDDRHVLVDRRRRHRGRADAAGHDRPRCAGSLLGSGARLREQGRRARVGD